MSLTADDDSYTFLVEWYDSVAEISRKYNLCYWPADNSCSMFDLQKRRLFLKRLPCTQKSSSISSIMDLFQHRTIVVFSRQLKILEYADQITKNKFALLSQTHKILFFQSANKFSPFAAFSAFILYAANKHKQQSQQNMNNNNSNCNNNQINSCCNLKQVFSLKLNQTQLQIIANISKFDMHAEESSDIIVASEFIGSNVAQYYRDWISTSYQNQNSSVLLLSDSNSNSNNPNPNSVSDQFCVCDELLFNNDNNNIQLKHSSAILNFDSASAATKTETQTQTQNSNRNNTSICLIKPHAFAELPWILNDILANGWNVTALTSCKLSLKEAQQFMQVYDGVIQEYIPLVQQLLAGNMIVIQLYDDQKNSKSNQNGDGFSSISVDFREFAGPRDPIVAKHIRENSLRAKYGLNRIQNAIHCTDLPEDGLLESQFFFQIIQQ